MKKKHYLHPSNRKKNSFPNYFILNSLIKDFIDYIFICCFFLLYQRINVTCIQFNLFSFNRSLIAISFFFVLRFTIISLNRHINLISVSCVVVYFCCCLIHFYLLVNFSDSVSAIRFIFQLCFFSLFFIL